jgi:hypothetical protein
MKYSKEQIIELSKPFFEAKEDLQMMYATSDNQFFYPESKSYAYAHQSSNQDLILYIIKREDALGLNAIQEDAIVFETVKEQEVKEEIIEKKVIKTRKTKK